MNAPLPPHLRRKRRNNLLFLLASSGLSLAVLAYFFIPRSTPAGSSKEAATQDPLAATAGESEESDFYSEDDGTGDDDNAPGIDAPLSEEELAKLPRWQAAFSRLPLDKRVAFASAFTKAKGAYNSRQWSICLSHLNACELIFAGNPSLWNLRACALLANNQQDEAEASLNRSLEIDPEDSVALMALSELKMQRQDFRGSITVLQQLRRLYSDDKDIALHDVFTFHQLLCHLMLRQEMEARALVAELTPMRDSPLYYFSQAAFCVYKGDSNAALEPLQSATAIYGNGGATSSYRKWMEKSGLAEKYVRAKRR